LVWLESMFEWTIRVYYTGFYYSYLLYAHALLGYHAAAVMVQ